MSARVLNPVILTEYHKLHSPVPIRRTYPNSKKLNQIKKDLFGPINPNDAKRFFDDEIEKHQIEAAKKWGFDFRTGYPIVEQSDFIWEPVTFNDFIPQMYTLTRAAHIRNDVKNYDLTSDEDILLDERADKQNTIINSDLLIENRTDESIVVPLVSTKIKEVISSNLVGKRQPKITEYMKQRKRLASAPKKISPAKRSRTHIALIRHGIND